MPNYANGKVYKLISSVDGRIYIGSTTVSLSTRLAQHKSTAKKTPTPVYRHFNTIGWDKVRIVLLETVTCFNKEQLIQREQHYIDLLKPSLNGRAAYVDCPHGRKHNNCKECHGVSICPHNRQKSSCKICGGVSICEHNREKSQCRDCGGGSICSHSIRKDQCKVCSPKHCEYCNITIGKRLYKQHKATLKHIYNFIHS